jgi:hypothetical protein
MAGNPARATAVSATQSPTELPMASTVSPRMAVKCASAGEIVRAMYQRCADRTRVDCHENAECLQHGDGFICLDVKPRDGGGKSHESKQPIVGRNSLVVCGEPHDRRNRRTDEQEECPDWQRANRAVETIPILRVAHEHARGFPNSRDVQSHTWAFIRIKRANRYGVRQVKTRRRRFHSPSADGMLIHRRMLNGYSTINCAKENKTMR